MTTEAKWVLSMRQTFSNLYAETLLLYYIWSAGGQLRTDRRRTERT